MWWLLLPWLVLVAYVASQSTDKTIDVEPTPTNAGALPPNASVVTPVGPVPASALPPMAPVWTEVPGSHGGGGNSNISCGQYATEALMRAACIINPACKGYSEYPLGKPWCMKHIVDTSNKGDPTARFWNITR